MVKSCKPVKNRKLNFFTIPVLFRMYVEENKNEKSHAAISFEVQFKKSISLIGLKFCMLRLFENIRNLFIIEYLKI